jgi:hypothetical protein
MQMGLCSIFYAFCVQPFLYAYVSLRFLKFFSLSFFLRINGVGVSLLYSTSQFCQLLIRERVSFNYGILFLGV